MRTDKHLSLLMVFLVLGSSLVTFCSASESRSQEVHFIAQSCGSHDCGRHAEPGSCASENCRHEICSDKSALGEYIPENLIQFETIMAAPVLNKKRFSLHLPNSSTDTCSTFHCSSNLKSLSFYLQKSTDSPFLVLPFLWLFYNLLQMRKEPYEKMVHDSYTLYWSISKCRFSDRYSNTVILLRGPEINTLRECRVEVSTNRNRCLQVWCYTSKHISQSRNRSGT